MPENVTTGPTLAGFLLARIAEDEAVARRVRSLPRWVMAHDLPNAMAGVTDHIVRWDPARVLAECEAKREIVGDCSRMAEDAKASGDPDAALWALGLYKAMRRLAVLYKDHPDYRDEWRP